MGGPNDETQQRTRLRLSACIRRRASREKRLSPTWWVSLSHRGKRERFSSGSDKRADAVRLLKQKLADLGAAKPVGNDVDRTNFEDLAAMFVDNTKPTAGVP